jgi:hypothetical protein
MGAAARRRKNAYVKVDETLRRLSNNTFAQGTVATVAEVLQYLDAAAFQLWDLKH